MMYVVKERVTFIVADFENATDVLYFVNPF